MKNLVYTFLLLVLTGYFLSCASSYKPIRPERMPFTSLASDGDVAMGYRYDVLREAGNKKHSKKEAKKGLKVVAISITNNTDKPLVFGTDIYPTSGGNSIMPATPIRAFDELKQNTPVYLLYGLLTFVKLTITKTNQFRTETDVYPIGYVIGPVVTLGNVAVSAGANKKFKDELMFKDLWGKTIEPGKTVYGLMTIQGRGYDALGIKAVGTP